MWETAIVILIVVIATSLVGRSFYRTMARRRGCACAAGCPLAKGCDAATGEDGQVLSSACRLEAANAESIPHLDERSPVLPHSLHSPPR